MEPKEHRELYKLEDDYWWFKAKRRLALSVVNRLKKKQHSRVCLLDVGCGTGAILQALEKFTYSVGMEKYPEALKFCRQRKINRLVNAATEDLPFKKGSFDIVLAMDVLEHLDSHSKVLDELSRVSKEGASLIVHVPAFMFFWSDHDLAVGHKRRYSAKMLIELLEKHNFKVKFINYRLFSFFILGVVRKYYIMIRKMLARDKSVKSHRPPAPGMINAILYNIIRVEDFISGFVRLPFGLSILCIAEAKPDKK
ncbi:MAG: class I SAM-dependent methyltransferase [Candidatus Omnitrophota bacterium]|nr:class I SAM-dependent methyltransferase [Candidatus Omnitrophota bacterium]